MTNLGSDLSGQPPSGVWDVVVVGGGVAGLSAALTLARSRRSVLVVDAGHPRNAPAAHAHGLLSRDGIPPLELLARGRQEIAGYGGHLVQGSVIGIEGDLQTGFRVHGVDQTWSARRLLVATGLTDQLPEVSGVSERWGRDVLQCPYCHGWEIRDQPLGILATNPGAVSQALLFRQWSSDVTLFTHTGLQLSEEQWAQLAARHLSVVDGKVTGLEVTDDQLSGVWLASGHLIPRRALVVLPRFAANGAVLTSLGLGTVEHPMGVGHHLAVDATGATTVPGVWAAGNVTDLFAGVVQSAAGGVTAAAAINHDLVTADTAAAVAAAAPVVRSGPSDWFSAEMEARNCTRISGSRRHGLDTLPSSAATASGSKTTGTSQAVEGPR